MHGKEESHNHRDPVPKFYLFLVYHQLYRAFSKHVFNNMEISQG